MISLQSTVCQWVLGVGICFPLIFIPQWTSAANVSDLPLAPNFYSNIHIKLDDEAFSSEKWQGILFLAENTNTGNSRALEVSDGDRPRADLNQETSLPYEDLEDPFDTYEEKGPELQDPFESHNRFIFNLNNKIYNHFTRHVAKGYRFTVPLELRIAIRNAFNNATMPARLLSSIIQGDMEKSGRVIGRFLINSTVGLGGLLDVADQEYNIKPANENMEQALGYYDVPSGPYLVLPVLGPSSVRNVFGRVADVFASPAYIFSAPFAVSAGVATGKKINETSFLIKTKKELEEFSIDEYESVRNLYQQYQNHLIKE
jgi:phospholipid-binding lipoprotein MlaA